LKEATTGGIEMEHVQEETQEETREELQEKISAYVIQQIKAGSKKAEISQKLMEMGVEKETADNLVESIYAKIATIVQRERFTAASLVPAILGAGAAAIVGGAVWGLIAIVTGYEIGYVAWGIGFLAGVAVVYLTGGKRGFPLQIIATLSSVAGIAVGKYITFFHFFKEGVEGEYGKEAAARVSILSASLLQIFVENAAELLGGFDVLWVVLAVITAWRIPRDSGIALKPGTE
jgi:Fe2+ transport system protein FeoA